MLAQPILGIVLVLVGVAVPLGADLWRFDWNTGTAKGPYPMSAAYAGVGLFILGVILIVWR